MPKLVIDTEAYEFTDKNGATLFSAPILEVGYLIGSLNGNFPEGLSSQEKHQRIADELNKQYSPSIPFTWFGAMQLTNAVQAEIESLKKTESTAPVSSSQDTKDFIPTPTPEPIVQGMS